MSEHMFGPMGAMLEDVTNVLHPSSPDGKIVRTGQVTSISGPGMELTRELEIRCSYTPELSESTVGRFSSVSREGDVVTRSTSLELLRDGSIEQKRRFPRASDETVETTIDTPSTIAALAIHCYGQLYRLLGIRDQDQQYGSVEAIAQYMFDGFETDAPPVFADGGMIIATERRSLDGTDVEMLRLTILDAEKHKNPPSIERRSFTLLGHPAVLAYSPELPQLQDLSLSAATE